MTTTPDIIETAEKLDREATQECTHGPTAFRELKEAREKLDAAKAALGKLTKAAYGEANRLSNHGSNGLEKLVGSNLYDAANEAAAALRALEGEGHLAGRTETPGADTAGPASTEDRP